MLVFEKSHEVSRDTEVDCKVGAEKTYRRKCGKGSRNISRYDVEKKVGNKGKEGSSELSREYMV